MFRAHNDADFSRVRKCKCWLLVLELAVYSVFLGICIYLFIKNKDGHAHVTGNNVWFAFSNTVWIAMPVIGFLSARHINKNSRSVERLGIRPNSRVLKLYQGFWLSFSLICITIRVLMILLTQDHALHGWEHGDTSKFEM